MKTYIFKHSLLGVIVGLSILGCTEGDKFDYNKNVAFITGTETTPVTKFVVEDTPSSYAITASTTDKVDKDVNVKFAIDRSLVESYNQEHNTKYYAIPDGAAVLENADAVIQGRQSLLYTGYSQGYFYGRFCRRACICHSCHYDASGGA